MSQQEENDKCEGGSDDYSGEYSGEWTSDDWTDIDVLLPSERLTKDDMFRRNLRKDLTSQYFWVIDYRLFKYFMEQDKKYREDDVRDEMRLDSKNLITSEKSIRKKAISIYKFIHSDDFIKWLASDTRLEKVDTIYRTRQLPYEYSLITSKQKDDEDEKQQINDGGGMTIYFGGNINDPNKRMTIHASVHSDIVTLFQCIQEYKTINGSIKMTSLRVFDEEDIIYAYQDKEKDKSFWGQLNLYETPQLILFRYRKLRYRGMETKKTKATKKFQRVFNLDKYYFEAVQGKKSSTTRQYGIKIKKKSKEAKKKPYLHLPAISRHLEAHKECYIWFADRDTQENWLVGLINYMEISAEYLQKLTKAFYNQ